MLAILSIETATDACSVALLVNQTIRQKHIVAPQQHAQLLLKMCDELLREADLSPGQLSAIAFGRGPGSFTGVRIAAAAAQGMALAHDLPVLPISTLQTLAQQAYQQYQVHQVLAGLDARMHEIYWGEFALQKSCMQPVAAERVAAATALPVPAQPGWFGAGTAWKIYQQELMKKFAPLVQQQDASLLPTATALLQLAQHAWQQGQAVSAEQAVPIYLRDRVV